MDDVTCRNVETTAKTRTIREDRGTCGRFSAARTMGIRISCRRSGIRRTGDGLLNAMIPRLKRATPPGSRPAARGEREGCGLGFDGVAALPVLALGGRHRQAHLLAYRPRQESAHGMRLPAGSLHQLLGGDAAGPLQQFQNLVGLAALAGAFGFLRAFGRFLGRGGLLAGLPLLLRNVGALWRNDGPFCWLWAGSLCGRVGEVAVSSAIEIMFSPWAVITASRHGSLRCVRESKRILRQSQEAMERRSAASVQMAADGVRWPDTEKNSHARRKKQSSRCLRNATSKRPRAR